MMVEVKTEYSELRQTEGSLFEGGWLTGRSCQPPSRRGQPTVSRRRQRSGSTSSSLLAVVVSPCIFLQQKNTKFQPNGHTTTGRLRGDEWWLRKLGAPAADCVSRRVGGCEHYRRLGYWRPTCQIGDYGIFLLGQVNGLPLGVFEVASKMNLKIEVLKQSEAKNNSRMTSLLSAAGVKSATKIVKLTRLFRHPQVSSIHQPAIRHPSDRVRHGRRCALEEPSRSTS